ncbi:glycosyltransferase family 2 protein [Mesorhizobium australicum]|uniref:glycosyltransferase family 2 protein n=1 Tax=Mesorhizobium australicum TaxID=536018 RepID=UPI00333ADD91
MKKSDVAVVIPYYNGSKYIRRAVESVRKQTVSPAEFVVVNDGSSQEEAAFLHDLANGMDFKVIDKTNGGQGTARNAGVAATVSPYICLLDQDDYFLPKHIEILLDAVQDDDLFGWAYADLMEADGEGNIVRSEMIKHHCSHNPKSDIFRMIAGDMFVLPSASIIKRSAFDAVGGFDVQFMGYEDDDLFMRMFRAGFSNIFVDQPVTVWCINEESTSFGIRMSRSRWLFIQKIYRDFPNDTVRKRFVFRDCLVPRFQHIIIAEAYQAAIRPDTRRGKALAPHRDELISILTGFKDAVLRDPATLRRTKLKTSVQTWLICTRSRFLNEAALFLAALVRKSLVSM